MVLKTAIRKGSGILSKDPSKAQVLLTIDQNEVRAGSVVTGKVQVFGDYSTKKVTISLQGLEYTVVAFPRNKDNNMGLDYLKKHTSEGRCFMKQDLDLDCTAPQKFHFDLSNNLPGTMRVRLEGTDPTLPSQCQVQYVVSASVGSADQKTKVSYPIKVIPHTETNVVIDDSIFVSIGSTMDVLFKSIFAWTDRLCYQPSQDDEGYGASGEDNYMILESSVDSLNIRAGQVLGLQVQDWFRLFSVERNCVWMFKLTEELTWTAQGRRTRSTQSWNVFAGHHPFPMNLRKSTNGGSRALWQINHELVVYVARRSESRNDDNDDTEPEILAATDPIPVKVVSNSEGFDA